MPEVVNACCFSLPHYQCKRGGVNGGGGPGALHFGCPANASFDESVNLRMLLYVSLGAVNRACRLSVSTM